jgi:hypothetical protein
MAKKKPKPATPPTTPPFIFEAWLDGNGTVIRGKQLTEAEAITRRRAGADVVVCGPSLAANRRLAGSIARSATCSVRCCPPHESAGEQALPCYQPDQRPPEGHTFYETDNRKAV